MFIVPSPNFLWNTLTPASYFDRSIFWFVFGFPKLLKKLSAVFPNEKPAFLLLAATLGCCSAILYVFMFPLSLLPYVQLYDESLNI